MKKDKKYNIKKPKTIRLSDSTIETVYSIAKKEKISESELFRSFIEEGISRYRLKKAFDAITKRNVSISAAADIAGLSYRDFYNKLIESRILSSKEIKSKQDNKLSKQELEMVGRAIENELNNIKEKDQKLYSEKEFRKKYNKLL